MHLQKQTKKLVPNYRGTHGLFYLSLGNLWLIFVLVFVSMSLGTLCDDRFMSVCLYGLTSSIITCVRLMQQFPISIAHMQLVSKNKLLKLNPFIPLPYHPTLSSDSNDRAVLTSGLFLNWQTLDGESRIGSKPVR